MKKAKHVAKSKKRIRSEIPSKYLRRVIRQARKNRKEGKGSPVFRTGKAAVAWLKKQGI